jgi:ADP-ribose pyrophosphatase YjhB (NUDIX family)
MSQKYALYLNQKALFFNNPQDIQPQADKLMFHTGTTLPQLLEAIELLKAAADKQQQLKMTNLSMARGLELLKTQYQFLMAAGGIVETPDYLSLFIHRLGCWDLPKGKVEQGEALPVAAQREIEEETGITDLKNAGELCRTWHTYEHKGRAVLKETVWYLFKTQKAWPTVPQTEEDITEAVWKSRPEWTEIEAETYPSIRDVMACRKALNDY